MNVAKYFEKLGREGGKKAARQMSAEARHERAKKAAAARWSRKG